MHIHAVWPGSTLLADQLEVLILISLKWLSTVSKMEGGLFHLRNSAGLNKMKQAHNACKKLVYLQTTMAPHQGKSSDTWIVSRKLCTKPAGEYPPRPILVNVGSPSAFNSGKIASISSPGARGLSGIYPGGILAAWKHVEKCQFKQKYQ